MSLKMFTADQAEKFIVEKLDIKDWRLKAKESRVELLHEIDRQWKLNVYYHNLPWGGKEFSELQPPTEQDCVDAILNNNGGVCLQNNYFMYLLLRYMGYDVFIVGCSTIDVSLANNHILVIVRFPQSPFTTSDWKAIPGYESYDVFMVDVGWVRPLPFVVHLNRLPLVYKAAGFKILYDFIADKRKFEIQLINGDPLKGAFIDDSPSRKYADFDLVPLKFEDFYEPMRQTFTNPDYGYFLHTVSAVRYISLNNGAENMFVGFRGRNLIVITPDHMEVTMFDTYLEMSGVILKYFPDQDQEMLKKALENYEARQRHYKSAMSLNPHATAGVGYKLKWSAGQ